MQHEVVMPKMGESLQEGTITQWLKQVGDKIERDEMILEISTDKVDTEVPSPVEGTLTQILVQEEETVEVGTPIAIIDTEGGAPAPVSTPKAEPEPTPAPAPAPAPAAPEPTPAATSGGDVTDLVMPKMGESLQEGTIVKWLKQPGDKLERDEMILEISTDKVDTEVPSPVEGTLVEILVQEEETVEVGTVIAKITSGSGAVATPSPAPKPEAKPAPAPAAAPSQPAQQQAAKTAAPTQTVTGSTFEIPRKSNSGRFYSPLVRAIANDNKVSLEELETISGTGVDSRVSKDDLFNYIKNRPAAGSVQAPVASAQPTTNVASTPAPKPTQASAPANYGSNVEVIPMDRMRKLISAHMVQSKQTSAHVTSVAEVDMTNIWNLRNKLKNSFQQREGIKLTFTSFFAKALTEGLRQFPMLNVSVDGTNILKHRNVNLGFATALPDGNLIVPVIKNADGLSLTGLQRSITDLANRARTKKLDPNDIQGGTITLTNVGTFGTLFGTPIINQPQTCIIGVGAIKKRPMVIEANGHDSIQIRNMMYMSITYDHRVIDGMLAGQALAAMVNALENVTEDNIIL
ncbi:2-oxoglutarate dehydrogenase, E2 component, dihydrolipoamide succinyltransferase [Candidatus Kapabacteria bacterium]|nr:2-oxoglutarate dehydrogenase, E2 component, dihydrolipoamide succinyltransferase [Candidatus Kapabacteria bacterium]